jgi:hypothetical protein
MQTIDHAKAATWARKLYSESVDRKDAAGFAAVFTETGTLRFGNNHALVGRGQIESAIAQFFEAMETLQHEFVAISCDRKTIFLEAKVTYKRHDGGTITVPAMTVFVMEDTSESFEATDCRIYVDLTPLFESAEESKS